MGAHRGCEDGVAAQLDQLLTRRLDYLRGDGAEWFEAAQNAQIVREAERYYRAIYQGAAASWNLRDRHMFNTLGAVMAHRGAGAALVAATSAGPPITAVVSRGVTIRPDDPPCFYIFARTDTIIHPDDLALGASNRDKPFLPAARGGMGGQSYGGAGSGSAPPPASRSGSGYSYGY